MNERPGTNVNVNNAQLSEAIIHAGLNKFPQSIMAQVHSTRYPIVAGTSFPINRMWSVQANDGVPPTEVWFIGADGTLLGRVVNLSVGGSAVPHITQDDSLDFVDEEGNPQRVQKQRERRVKDSLL